MSQRLSDPTAAAKRGLRILALGLLVVVVLASVAHAVPVVVGAEDSYIVTSDSMSPTVGVGDVIYVYHAAPGTIDEGDIISFVPGAADERARTDRVVTHRVVEVQQGEQGVEFVTQGDANEDPDPDPVRADSVIGRVPTPLGVPLHAPFLGRLLLLAGSRVGIVLLVFVPVAILIGNELYTLVRARETASTDSGGTSAEPDPEEG